MLLPALVLLGAVASALLAGGRLGGFEGVHLRWWPMALIGLAMQLAPVPDLGGDGEDLLGLGLLLASYVPLTAFAVANLRQPGFWLVTAGLALNLLVISVNAGMPVTREAVVASGQADSLGALDEGRGAKHHLADRDEDVLLFLADVIPLAGPFRQVVSAGDLVLYAGIGWFVFGTMRRGRRRGGRLVGFEVPTPPRARPPAPGPGPGPSAPSPGPGGPRLPAPSPADAWRAPSAAAPSGPGPSAGTRPAAPIPPPEPPGATTSGTEP